MTERAAAIARFHAVVAEVLDRESVSPDDHFLELGGDSLDAVVVIERMDREFGIRPDLATFFESESLADLTERWWRLAPPAPPRS